MNKELWLSNSFLLGETTKWQCPTCGKGVLKSEKRKTLQEETFDSKKDHTHPDWEPEFALFRYTAILTCTNSACNDIVVCAGDGGYTTVEDEHGNDHPIEEFHPVLFHPPLYIFQIPTSCPKLVREEIVKSFSLVWTDLASSANKIGIAVERIMNDKKIKQIKIITSGGRRKRKGLSLHQRIDGEFRSRYPDIADQFLAVKWIRNAGSHAEVSISKNDVLDAYEILEHALEELYEERSKKIKKRTKEINKAKGLQKKRKKKIRTTGI